MILSTGSSASLPFPKAMARAITATGSQTKAAIISSLALSPFCRLEITEIGEKREKGRTDEPGSIDDNTGRETGEIWTQNGILICHYSYLDMSCTSAWGRGLSMVWIPAAGSHETFLEFQIRNFISTYFVLLCFANQTRKTGHRSRSQFWAPNSKQAEPRPVSTKPFAFITLARSLPFPGKRADAAMQIHPKATPRRTNAAYAWYDERVSSASHLYHCFAQLAHVKGCLYYLHMCGDLQKSHVNWLS